MFIHDTIKIKYIREGFLPDYPYHLISDEEMFKAFYTPDKLCFFSDSYPCIHDRLRDRYNNLIDEIQYHVDLFNNEKVEKYIIPNWVYSYMIGSVIGPNSSLYDIHDLLVLMNLDNVEDELRLEAYEEMYKISLKHIRKLTKEEREHRPPTIFGEPHVLKILRLEQAQTVERM